MSKNIDSKKDEEINKNFEFFNSQLPSSLMQKHAGEYALIKNQKIIGFFSSAKDVQQASSLIKDNIFSIQKVEVTPKNLGYFSYAMA